MIKEEEQSEEEGDSEDDENEFYKEGMDPEVALTRFIQKLPTALNNLYQEKTEEFSKLNIINP